MTRRRRTTTTTTTITTITMRRRRRMTTTTTTMRWELYEGDVGHWEETRIWNGENKVFDYSKIRVTQIPTNRRVIPPKPLTGTSKSKELKLQFMKARLLEETRKHLKKKYDNKGRPKENNITPIEVKGLKAAKDLTENGDVIIRPTDKTGKHSIQFFCILYFC